MSKESIRQKIKAILADLLDEPEVIEKSEKACSNLIACAEYENASVIMMYLSMPDEIDTGPAILNAWKKGKTVVVPKIIWGKKHMIPVKIESLDDEKFSTDIFGLRNPVNGKAFELGKIDLVVIPALGFDREGNRLGRGGGYYDRFLALPALRAKKAGIGFAKQVIDSFPVNKFDQKINFLVTDKETIYF